MHCEFTVSLNIFAGFGETSYGVSVSLSAFRTNDCIKNYFFSANLYYT